MNWQLVKWYSKAHSVLQQRKTAAKPASESRLPNNSLLALENIWLPWSSHSIFISVFLFRAPTKMTTKAPTFTQPLQSVVALEGSAATFEAHISGKASYDHFCLFVLQLSLQTHGKGNRICRAPDSLGHTSARQFKFFHVFILSSHTCSLPVFMVVGSGSKCTGGAHIKQAQHLGKQGSFTALCHPCSEKHCRTMLNREHLVLLSILLLLDKDVISV